MPLQRLPTPLFWARTPSPIFPTNLYSKFHCLHLRCIVVLRWICNRSTVHINNWLFDSNSYAFCILQPFFIFRNIPQYKLQREMSVLWFFSFFVLICIFQIHFFFGGGGVEWEIYCVLEFKSSEVLPLQCDAISWKATLTSKKKVFTVWPIPDFYPFLLMNCQEPFWSNGWTLE